MTKDEAFFEIVRLVEALRASGHGNTAATVSVACHGLYNDREFELWADMAPITKKWIEITEAKIKADECGAVIWPEHFE